MANIQYLRKQSCVYKFLGCYNDQFIHLQDSWHSVFEKGYWFFFYYYYLVGLASEKFCVRHSAQLLYFFLFGLIIQNNNILSRISLADLKNLSAVFEEI